MIIHIKLYGPTHLKSIWLFYNCVIIDSMSYPKLEDIRPLFDGLIFDLDGTLLDSMNLWTEADVSFLSKRGFEVTPDYTDYVKSVSIEDAAQYTKKRFNLPDTPQEIMDEWNGFVRKGYRETVHLKPGAKEYLLKAREMDFTIGCATALTRPNAEAVLKRCGVLDVFNVFFTLDDIKGCPDKRHPDIYLKTATAMGTTPQRTLVFEDVPLAINGATIGGFKTCAVFDIVGVGTENGWQQLKEASNYNIRYW